MIGTRSVVPLAGLLLLAAPLARAMPLCEPVPCALREAARAAGIEIGVAVEAAMLAPGSASAATIAREFSSLTAENAMKWQPLAPAAPGVYAFDPADAIVDFAQAQGQRVRGHTLFWGSLNGPPTWLSAELAVAPDPSGRLRELMAQHVSAVVGRYAGRSGTWDVVNEPLVFNTGELDPANPFQRVLGESYIADAFRLAHAADPAATLYLNETLLETNGPKFDGLLGRWQRGSSRRESRSTASVSRATSPWAGPTSRRFANGSRRLRTSACSWRSPSSTSRCSGMPRSRIRSRHRRAPMRRWLPPASRCPHAVESRSGASRMRTPGSTANRSSTSLLPTVRSSSTTSSLPSPPTTRCVPSCWQFPSPRRSPLSGSG